MSPVLFILSVSALFPWLEDRHTTLQGISFVDDICLVIECEELEEGTRKLESIADDAMLWSVHNKVEFEVSKTKFLCSVDAEKSSKRQRIRCSQLESRLSQSSRAQPSGLASGSIRNYLSRLILKRGWRALKERCSE